MSYWFPKKMFTIINMIVHKWRGGVNANEEPVTHMVMITKMIKLESYHIVIVMNNHMSSWFLEFLWLLR
jgi:hypothetical protein